ncbi:hypothetical protein [Amycolatopsis sp. NPDC059021]|uniref:hypothetical protein n=1 Tax=Amycolatopsis sp. NPDC059021 TaxID=3346704 RepID=UPI003673040C
MPHIVLAGPRPHPAGNNNQLFQENTVSNRKKTKVDMLIVALDVFTVVAFVVALACSEWFAAAVIGGLLALDTVLATVIRRRRRRA